MNITESIGAHALVDALPVQSIFDQRSVEDWNHVRAPLFAVSPISTEVMQAPFDARVWGVGPCLFSRATNGGQIIRRTLDQVGIVARFIMVSRYVSGCAVGSSEDGPFNIDTGKIVVRDFSHPFDALQYRSLVETVLIPYRFLDLCGAAIPSVCVVSEDSAAAQVIQSALNETFLTLEHDPGGFSQRLMDRFMGAARAAVLNPQGAPSARHSVRLAQRAAIERFIEDNLGRLDLSAELILPQFGVSRATLYRLFEDQGGVRTYIVGRRLYRALLDISDGPRQRGKIQDVAKRWGFSSAANFNRSVRQVFGGTPGSLFSGRAKLTPGQSLDMAGAGGPKPDIWRPLQRLRP